MLSENDEYKQKANSLDYTALDHLWFNQIAFIHNECARQLTDLGFETKC